VGNGPDLLLIHGTATDASSWAPLIRLLQGRFRLVTYDRRGAPGWPTGDAAPLPSASDHAADAADLISALGRGPVHVCGLSFGAVVALELMRRRPELVRSAALFEPALASGDQLEGVPAALVRDFERLVRAGKGPQAAERFHRRLLSDRGWNLLPPETKIQARSLWRQIHCDLSATAAYRPRYDEMGYIEVPVLLLRGGRSRAVFEPAIRALSAALPRSQRKLIANTGHWIASQGWQELAEALAEFMGA
jgi:pimeloyl-ACP methyl ester carboxylesterase